GGEVTVRGVERHRLVLEPALVKGADGVAVRTQGPVVQVLAADPHPDGGVPADRDRHVEVGRGGAVGGGRRRPGGGPRLGRAGGGLLGRGRVGVDATGDDKPVHAGADGARGQLYGGEAGGAVSVQRHAGDLGQPGRDGRVAGDDTAAVV